MNCTPLIRGGGERFELRRRKLFERIVLGGKFQFSAFSSQPSAFGTWEEAVAIWKGVASTSPVWRKWWTMGCRFTANYEVAGCRFWGKWSYAPGRLLGNWRPRQRRRSGNRLQTIQ